MRALSSKKSVAERLQDVETRLKGLSDKSSAQRKASETMLLNLQAKKIARNGTSAALAPKH